MKSVSYLSDTPTKKPGHTNKNTLDTTHTHKPRDRKGWYVDEKKGFKNHSAKRVRGARTVGGNPSGQG